MSVLKSQLSFPVKSYENSGFISHFPVSDKVLTQCFQIVTVLFKINNKKFHVTFFHDEKCKKILIEDHTVCQNFVKGYSDYY